MCFPGDPPHTANHSGSSDLGKPLPVGAECPISILAAWSPLSKAEQRGVLPGVYTWQVRSLLAPDIVSRRPPSRWCRAGATQPRLSPKVLAAEVARAGAQGGEAVPTPNLGDPPPWPAPEASASGLTPPTPPAGRDNLGPLPRARAPPPPVASAAGRRSPGAPPSLPEKNSPRRQRATREKRTRGCALLMAGGGRRGSRGKPSCRSTPAPASREQAGSAVRASESDGCAGGH